jgi:hypothetical protein
MAPQQPSSGRCVAESIEDIPFRAQRFFLLLFHKVENRPTTLPLKTDPMLKIPHGCWHFSIRQECMFVADEVRLDAGRYRKEAHVAAFEFFFRPKGWGDVNSFLLCLPPTSQFHPGLRFSPSISRSSSSSCFSSDFFYLSSLPSFRSLAVCLIFFWRSRSPEINDQLFGFEEQRLRGNFIYDDSDFIAKET